MVHHAPGNTLPDPFGGIGGKPVIQARVKFPGGDQQADTALLDQIQQRHTSSGILSGYGNHQPQIGIDHVTDGIFIAFRAQTGELTSARFLDVSRPEDAPTHNLFEWNDSVAAERYRLQQATVAINSVEVQIVNESTATAISQAAFVNVISKAPARTGEFAPIDVALSDANMRNALLQNALKELQSFRRKYSQLSELTAVFAEIKKVEQAS